MTGFDMTDTIIPRSDQLNAEDLLTGPRTVTITEVRPGSTEQPVEVVTDEFGPARPFKPSKTVRRIMVAAWGREATAYVGHRMTLYRDPGVRFGGQDVGGIRVSHMSHIEKRLSVALTVTRGKRAAHVVEPLADEPKPAPTAKPDSRLTEIVATLGKLGVTKKTDCLAVVSRIADRKLASAIDLTPDELTTVIDTLNQLPDDPARVRAIYELDEVGTS